MDANVVPALIATFISGLSTAIGGLFILFYGEPSNTKLGHMLSISSGVMIYISFMDLLTESVIRIGFVAANLCFFAGMLFFAFIITFFPEPEFIEKEGKDSDDEDDNKNGKKKKKPKKKGSKNNKPSSEYLKKLGVITAVGISLHNFPEGMAVYISCLKGIHLGLPLTLAIAAHNIPEGMAVAAPIYGATGSKWQAFYYSLLSGLCEPLGAIIFGILLGSYLTEYIIQCMLAGVAGIMVYMSIRELMPATLKYIKPGPAALSNIFGMAMIAASVHYLHGMLPHSHAPLYYVAPPTTSGVVENLATAAAAAIGGGGGHEHSASCGHAH